MPKSSSEQVANILLQFLPNLLPKPMDSVATSVIETFRVQLDKLISHPRIQTELLEAAKKAERNFLIEARNSLKNDEIIQAVVSLPLYDNKKFQETLILLPGHLNEELLAKDLQRIISDDWKGGFSPVELREAITIYLNCLRVQLLKVDSYTELITRLSTLRIDAGTEKILDTVKDLQQVVSSAIEQSRNVSEAAPILFTIPKPVVDFTGRETELERLKDSFLQGAIITGLSGGGGIGKTELAYKLIDAICDNYPDAQIEIDLLGTSDTPLLPEDAMRRILGKFYQNLPKDDRELKGLYQQTFSTQRALLLLDNAANANQVRQLVLRPPVSTAFIITSRQYFSLSEFGLLEPLRLDVFSKEQSRNLLKNICAKLIETPDEEIDQLSELCGHLPLALRIAASLLNDRPDWDLEKLTTSLIDERTRLMRLKREDDSDLDLEATLALSYNLLSAEMRMYFRALGVLPSSFKKYSLAAICDLDNEYDAEHIIGILLKRNLIYYIPDLSTTIRKGHGVN